MTALCDLCASYRKINTGARGSRVRGPFRRPKILWAQLLAGAAAGAEELAVELPADVEEVEDSGDEVALEPDATPSEDFAPSPAFAASPAFVAAGLGDE